METFHLLHLAQSYNRSHSVSKPEITSQTAIEAPPVPQTRPPAPGITLPPPIPASDPETTSQSESTLAIPESKAAIRRPSQSGAIYAAAAQMVFASRITTNAFISPEEVIKTQEWAGRACLEALAAI